MNKSLDKQTLMNAIESVFGQDFAQRVAVIPMSMVSKEFCFALVVPQMSHGNDKDNKGPRSLMVLIKLGEKFYGTRGYVDQYSANLLDENGPVGMTQQETLEELFQFLKPNLCS